MRLISQFLNYQFIHVLGQSLLWGTDRLILTKLLVTWESEKGCCTTVQNPPHIDVGRVLIRGVEVGETEIISIGGPNIYFVLFEVF
jgi:hypothetical protein